MKKVYSCLGFGSKVSRILLSFIFTISCINVSAQQSITTITSSNDDLEERVSSGGIYDNSSDLELIYDGTDQYVGLRFNGVSVPGGAAITSAYLTFFADESQSGVTNLLIEAEDADHCSPFGTSNYACSSRPTTTATVNWNSLPGWTSGEIYDSPDISNMIQEVVNRSGWTSGNSMALFISGQGHRTAHSYDGSSTKAPRLTINYTNTTCGNISALKIYDQITDQEVPGIGPIYGGLVVDANLLPANYYLVVETEGTIESVSITVDGVSQSIENVALYTFPNGAEGGSNWNGGEGVHTVDMTAYKQDNGSWQCDNRWTSFTISGGCTPTLTIVNEGSCKANIYEWLPGGDIFETTLIAGGSYTLQTTDGAVWRAVDIVNDWNNLLFDEHYTQYGCNDETWIITPEYCNPVCSAAFEHVDVVDETSCDANDGQIIHDPWVDVGTVLPYNLEYTFDGQVYSFGPYAINQDNVISGLAPGLYSNITIIDANGCTNVWGDITIHPAVCCPDINLTANLTGNSSCVNMPTDPCLCDGKLRNITVIYNGPDGGDVTAYNDNSSVVLGSFSNVNNGQILYVEAGTYNNGQFDSKTFWSTDGGTPVEIHTSCSQDISGETFGNFTVIGYTDGAYNECNPMTCSGSIDLTVSGGTGPYSYNWSNGSSSQDLSNLCEGTYTVTVTDGYNCSSTQTFTIGLSTPQIDITGSTTPNTTCVSLLPPCNCECDGKMREVTATFTGQSGATVAVYNDNLSHTFATFTNVQNGQSLVVSALGYGNDEFDSKTKWQTNNFKPVEIHTSCSQDIGGQQFGDFLVTGFIDGAYNECLTEGCVGPCECSGGIAEITFVYTGPNGGNGSVNDGNDIIIAWNNLQNGQIVSVNSNLIGLDDLPNTDIYYNGVNQGQAHTSCSVDLYGISYGPFTVLGFVDKNGNECNGINCTGTATASASGGAAPYTYDWSDGSTGETATGLCDGTYIVTATDANGCTAEETFEVGLDVTPIDAEADITANGCDGGFEILPPCNCECDGKMREVTATYTGPSGATVTVYNDNLSHTFATFNNVQNGQSLVVNAGAYNNNQFDSKTKWQTNNNTPVEIHTSCSQDIGGQQFGDFLVTGFIDGAYNECLTEGCVGPCECSGGIAEITFVYTGPDGENGSANDGNTVITAWNNLQNGQIVSVNSSIIGQDDLPNVDVFFNGVNQGEAHTSCSQDLYGNTYGPFTVIGFVDKNGNECNGVECFGAIDLTVTSGTAPFIYSWSNGETTEDISGLCPGTYSVTVTDANGCMESFEFDVEDGSPLDVTITGDTDCIEDCTGSLTAIVSGGDAPYTYEWSNSETTESISGLCPGTYSVTVTDSNGCTGTAEVEIVGSDLTVSVDDKVICIGESATLTAEVTGEATCTSECDLNESLLVTWDMEACQSNSGTGTNADYSEFTASSINNGSCTNVSASNVYRESGNHSCTPGYQGSVAMCVGTQSSCDPNNYDESYAVKFNVTLDPTDIGQLSKLEFQEKAPDTYEYIGGGSGANNYPQKYLMKVRKNGALIFEQSDINTTQNWSLESFDFSSNPLFEITETATFSFELRAYCRVGNGASTAVWDLDQFQVYGACCTQTTVNELTYLWSTGETTASITVTPTSTTTYSVTVTDCAGCTATDDATVTVDDPDGGDLEGGEEFCVGDGIPDFIPQGAITLTGEVGANFQWVITDDQGNILGLPASPYDVDFDGAGPGTCLVWHLTFYGDLTGAEVGNNASQLEGCYDLSNPVEIIRNTPDGGELEGGEEFCVGDGIPDFIPQGAITLTGEVGANFQWVITDDQGNILGLPASPYDVDFDGAGPGTCLVWHLAFYGDLTGAEIGNNASQLEGCYDLSNPVEIIRNTPDGGELEGGEEFCVGDGVPDFIPQGAITLIGEVGANFQWVVTDDQGNILGLPASPYDVDFDGAGPGTCLVWHLAFYGDLTGAEVGNNASQLEGCYDLSNPVEIIRTGLTTIGDYVWFDTNNDGCQDDDESGVEGVTIKLFECDDNGGNPGNGTGTFLEETTSDGTGFYEFEICFDPDANYFLQIDNIPADNEITTKDSDDCDDTADSDADPVTGKTECFMVPPGGKPDCDFGIFSTTSVGSTVYVDINDNGTQDAGEPGIANLPIEVWSVGPDGEKGGGDDVLAGTDTTDGNGDYFVDGLLPGDYYVKIQSPDPDYPTSSADIGTSGDPNNDTDSDDNGVQMGGPGTMVMSNVVTLTAGGEPTGEPGSGGNQDNGDDDNGNMTVDFGFVPYFDLALKKELSSVGPFGQGDDVTFTITVINQGTADATSITLTDYVPTGMTNNDPDWIGGTHDFGPLAAGTSGTVDITLTINNDFMGSSLVNYTEISDAENPAGSDDIDSTPDGTNGNDAGGVPNSPTDDEVDSAPPVDEDDHDPALIPVNQVFDLALTKVLSSAGPYVPGTDITFTINVFNQGTLDATDVEITDYIPAGFSLSTNDLNGWTDAGATATNSIDFLAAGGSTSLDIVLTFDVFISPEIVNYAEISDADNALGLPDVDSTPDDTNGNDAGGAPMTGSDDATGGDGSGNPGDGDLNTDEDDHDPAKVNVCDIEPPVVTCPPDSLLPCNSDVPPVDINLVIVTDNYGDVVVTHVSDVETIVGCVKTVVRTYQAVDVCDNVATCDQIFTIPWDMEPPVIDCPADVTLPCNSPPPPIDTLLTATDNCGIAFVTFGGDAFGGPGGGPCTAVITRTYIATDVCGNTSTCEQIITVPLDFQPPVITCPEDEALDCNAVPPAPDTDLVSATDNCGVESVYHISDVSSVDGCLTTVTRTYGAIDFCGNTNTCQQLFFIPTDTEPPVIVCSASQDLPCNSDTPDVDLSSVSATDNCAVKNIYHVSDVETIGNCVKTVVRTYGAIDFCDNTSICTQAFYIPWDTQPPLVFCPPNQTLECNAEVPDADTDLVVANDNCGVVSYAWEGDVESIDGCYKTVIRTYSATDYCDNTGHCTQTFHIPWDTEPPVVTCPPDVTLECNATVPDADTGLVIATDNCIVESYAHVGDVETIDGCYKYVVRTYSATDACDNTGTCTQTFTIPWDYEAPVLTCPDDLFLPCNSDIPDPDINSVTYSDICSDVTVTFNGDVMNMANCHLTVLRTYKAVDACGNVSFCTQLISIPYDIEAPILICPEDVELPCDSEVPPFNTNLVQVSDNCAIKTVYHVGDVVEADECLTVVTRTYGAIDFCGNVATCDQIFYIPTDTIPPVMDCPSQELECNVEAPAPDPNSISVTDNCLLVDVYHIEDVITLENCLTIVTRTYGAIDYCGNTSTCEQVFYIPTDLEPPVVTCPEDEELPCNSDTPDPDTGLVSATDNCGVAFYTWEGDDVSIANCVKTVVRTYSATDYCYNTGYCTQTFYIPWDTEPPVLTCPADTTLDCNVDAPAPNTQLVSATDNCVVESYAWEGDDVVIDGCYKYVYRTYSATDACDNTGYCTQMFTIPWDFEAPVVTCPADATLDCNVEAPAPNTQLVSATDNCVVESYAWEGDDVVIDGCYKYVYRTYSATDACDNTGYCTQMFTIPWDFEAPVVTCPADATLDCNVDAPAPNTQLVSATDNCVVESYAWEGDDVVIDGCYKYVYRTYSATDACDNTGYCTQLFTIPWDFEAPVVTCPADATLDCNVEAPAPNTQLVSATDNCVVESYAWEGDDVVIDGCYKYVYRTYSATDACDNTGYCTQMFTIPWDFEAPVVTCPADATLECNAQVQEPNLGDVSATDNCGIDFYSWEGDSESIDGCYKYVVRTFSATDFCDNTGTCTQLFTIPWDSEPPVVTCPADATLDCNATAPPANTQLVSATDNCEVVSYAHEGDVESFDDCYKYIVRTYSATDFCDNTGTCTQLFTIPWDTEPPVVTCPADTALLCNADVPAPDPSSVVATDNCGIESVYHINDVTIDQGCFKFVLRTYGATDNCGFSSTCEQEIFIPTDIVPPVIICPADEELECNSDAPAPNIALVSATDNCGVKSITHEGDEVVIDGCWKLVYRTYRAVDFCNNESFCVQTFHIPWDFEAPVVTCPEDEELPCNSDVPDPDTGLVSATDNCGVASYAWEGDNEEIDGCWKFVYRTYSATDFCGNTGYCTQTFHIPWDFEPPVLTCPPTLVLPCNSEIPQPDPDSVTYTDNCSSVTVTFGMDVMSMTDCQLFIFRTYNAVDACGNESSCTQQILIPMDNEAPVLTCPGDLTLDCFADTPAPNPGSVTVDDNCSTGTVVHEGDVETFDSCWKIVERTYSATDACNNTGYCAQYIYIPWDSEPPMVTCPTDATLDCNVDAPAPNTQLVSATDNCVVESYAWEGDDVVIDGCYKYVYRTYSATDACDNTGYCTQIFTIPWDFEAPVVTCPADATLDCNVDAPAPNTQLVSATDNCVVESYAWEGDEVVIDGCYKYVYRTYSATDACDNTGYCTQIFTIPWDFEAPVVTCPADATLDCNVEAPAPNTQLVSATDNCVVESYAWEGDEVVIDGCYKYVYRTYSATDACDNTGYCTQLFTIPWDFEAPVVTCPADATLDCNVDAPEPNTQLVSATDNCVVESYAWEGDEVVIDGCYKYVYRTYSATDACDNTGYCTQIFTIPWDFEPPVVTCPADATLDCNVDAPAPNTQLVSATDNCVVESYAWEGDDVVIDGCYKYVYRTYSATDACDNTGYCTQIFTIPWDFEAPVVTCPADATLDCNVDAPAPNTQLVSATDNCVVESYAWEGDEVVIDGCYKYVYRTYSATDACDNTGYCTQIFTIPWDFEAPVVTCPADATLDCNVDAPAPNTQLVSATDNCVVESYAWEGDDVVIDGCYKYVYRTYSATDACDNTGYCTQLFTIPWDFEAPVVTCPADATLDCNVDAPEPNTQLVSATDNCVVESYAWEGDEVVIDGCYKYLYRTYSATDACDNTGYCTQMFTIPWDFEAPVVTCPADATLDCNVDAPAPNTQLVSATDNCVVESYAWEGDEVVIDGCYKYLYRTYSATDACDNTGYCTQMFTIPWDFEAPVVTCPADATLDCNVEAPAPNTQLVSATDNCVVESYAWEGDEVVIDGCYKYVYRTYSATDACDNTGYCTQMYTIPWDFEAPVVTCPADATLDCNVDAPAPNTQLVSATDNCVVESYAWEGDEVVIDGCYKYVYRTYSATDACDNTGYCTQMYTIPWDFEAPVVTCPPDATLACNATVIPPADPNSVGATDNCGIESVYHIGDVSTVDGCMTIVTRTYGAVDNCGNASTCEQLFFIPSDSEPPVVICPDDEALECNAAVPTPDPDSVNATDNCGIESVYHVNDVTIDEGCFKLIIRTYGAVDYCGNSSTCEQEIFIPTDIVPPVITCPADEDLACNSDAPAPNIALITATDNCGVKSITHIGDEEEIDGCWKFVYRTYRAVDFCGNESFCTQTFHIPWDTELPVVTCPADATLECNATVPDADTDLVSATDNCIVESYAHVGDVETFDGCWKFVLRTYSATDFCDNTGTCTQLFTIPWDSEPPVLTCPDDATLECNATVPDADTDLVSATDNCIVESYAHVGDVETIDGCYKYVVRTYSATDACDNTGTCTQLFTIPWDSEAPVVTCPPDATLECNAEVQEPNLGDVSATDNCGIASYAWEGDEEFIEGCWKFVFRTFSATDFCDNTGTCTQLFTIPWDSQPPVVTCPADATLDCNATAPPANTQLVSAIDNCEVVSYAHEGDVETFDECYKYVVRTYSATDACDNTGTCTQLFTIPWDFDAPVLTCPESLILPCNSEIPDPDPSSVLWVDCFDVTVTHGGDVMNMTDCQLFVFRTYNAVDACGNESSCIQQILIPVDNDAPVLTCPDDVTLACNAQAPAPDPGSVTFTDNCSTGGVVWEGDDVTETNCGIVILRTYSVTDACLNIGYCTQSITIPLDAIPPVIACPDNLSLPCNAIVPAPDTDLVQASDNCGIQDVYHVSDVPAVQGCFTVITRTYAAVDFCDNVSTCTQLISVLTDAEPPVIDCPADLDLPCNAIVPPPNVNLVSATDNCGIEDVYHVSDVPAVVGCFTVWTRTYAAEDACGNVSTCTQLISVLTDAEPPVLTCPPAPEIPCNSDVPAPDPGSVSVTDNCGAGPVVWEGDFETIVTCFKTVERTYSSTDACGNVGTCIQTFTILWDFQAPVITCPEDAMVDCDNGSTHPDDTGYPTTVDMCTSVDVDWNDGPTSGTCPSSFVRTWTAEDGCGNTSTCTQLISVDDNTPPAIFCPADVTIECNTSSDTTITGSATYLDNCSAVSLTFNDGPTTGDCPYTFVRTWTATDACENSSSCVQIITIDDTIDPTFDSTPDNLFVECLDEVPPPATLTASDNCDLDVLVTLVVDPATDECSEGVRYTWTATDDCGNTAVHQQSIGVMDVTPPTALNIPADVTLECGTDPADDAPDFIDNCDDLVDVAFSTNTVNITCGIEITRQWIGTDNCDNPTTIIQVITIVDTMAPELVGVPADVTVDCNQIPAIAEVTAIDWCDDDVPVIFGESSTLGCPYTITRTWTATDDCGHTTTDSQVITVVDTTLPTIDCPPGALLDCNATPPAPNVQLVSASDDCSVPIVTFGGDVTTVDGCFTIVTRTYIATDWCDNVSSCTQMFTIPTDTEDPVITCPVEMTLDCNADVPEPNIQLVSATDNCGIASLVHSGDVADQSTCLTAITRTYTATDLCGNTASCTQLILIPTDTELPELTCPGDVTLECNADVPEPNTDLVTATDNCEIESIAWELDEVSFDDCTKIVARFYSATDACGNTGFCVQVFNIPWDSAPPVITCPADVSIFCEDSTDPLATGFATATDICGLDTITYSDVVTDSCLVIERTWVATDNCGNTSSCTQTITTIDNTPPEFLPYLFDIFVPCDDIPDEMGVTATDNCSDVLITFTEIEFSGGCQSTLLRTYMATDACGNFVTTQQFIHLEDFVLPTLNGVPADITVESLDDVPPVADVTVTDNCDPNPILTFTADTVITECGYIITRTWVGDDECDNMTVGVQIIEVIETPSPNGLTTTITGNGVILSWEGIPNPVACQINGGPVGGGTVNVNIMNPDVTSYFVPMTALNYNTMYQWRVREACSLSPITVSDFSSYDTFMIEDMSAGTDGVDNGGLGLKDEMIVSDDIELSIYPNPSNGVFTFETNVAEGYNLTIYDITGKVILEKANVESQVIPLDISGVESGIYFVRLSDGDVQKMIKLAIEK